MEPFTKFTGIVAPLEALNVDTDQIIPKQFLKRIERTGYGDFEMNAARYQGAGILLSKDNFGCGSSREHAPWALHDYGIRCILAPSFADIFYNNCFNNGMLPIRLPADVIEQLFQEVRAQVGYQLTVDLPEQRILRTSGPSIAFEVSPFLKQRLLNGWDQIGLTLRYADHIAHYEKRRGIA